ncbi:MAG TPA: hypothetical protein VMB66_12330 [Candidatus Acidoferrales bacterium]|nr:hypothetical protein [Candidatus Acidoferrales bacterium]
MKLTPRSLQAFAFLIVFSFLLVVFSPAGAWAQSCQTSDDMDAATRTALTNAGQRYFDMAAKGDSASLQQNAISSLAANFSEIQTLIKDRQPDLAGAQPNVKSVFLLDASGPAPIPHAEFLCGVFGKNGQTANSAAFYLNDLPPAKYAAVLIDATSAQGMTMFTEILQQVGTDWKLGGLYIKPAQVAGHNSQWFLDRAREYKAKGQMHNAWFYYEEARSLISPLSFMSTLATDNLYDESNNLRPADLPGGGKTADLVAGTTTYKLMQVFPQPIGTDLDLMVKFQVADASNANQSYADNMAVVKALVDKYPELRDAFASIEVLAVDPSGRNYGTLMAMKDIK